jgi:choline-glycine betaine transporter
MLFYLSFCYFIRNGILSVISKLQNAAIISEIPASIIALMCASPINKEIDATKSSNNLRDYNKHVERPIIIPIFGFTALKA